jgi:hypothetical protein
MAPDAERGHLEALPARPGFVYDFGMAASAFLVESGTG